MLVLASASPARRRLLEQAAIPHRVRVSGVDEEAISASDPAVLVQLLAQAKAEAVVQALQADGSSAEALGVLGCDSLLVFEGEVFGKPADQAEAAFLLVSGKRFPRTTGQVIHVDGGLADGFLR